jgi:Kdo2-lipid IVA lauroyltransferase/acyltransferase
MVGLISIIPFHWLYPFSKFCALFIQKILKYRLRTVKNNLQSVQHNLNLSNLDESINQFYRFLTFNILESIKGFTTPLDKLQSRYRITNPELVETYFSQKKSVLFIGSHYNNWEWGIQVFNLMFPHQVCGIYQQVSNPFIHRYLMKIRTRGGMKLISYSNAINQILSMQELNLIMILADQSPSNMEKAVWANFLGRKTPFVHGLEAMGKKTKWPIVYYEVILQKPGYYEIILHSLTANPENEAPNEITSKYASILEKTIQKDPSYWLWSHKRWKHAPK